MASRPALRLAKGTPSLFTRRIWGNRSWSRSSLSSLTTETGGCRGNLRSYSVLSWLDPATGVSSTADQRFTPRFYDLGSARIGSFFWKRGFSDSADLPPFQEIGMPALSPTMTQGNIAKWRKSVGESVSAGDVICEIETDKATLEMESMEDGYLAKILFDEGAKDLAVGTPIAIFVDNEEDVPKFSGYSAPSKPTPAPTKTATPSPPPSPPPSSPPPPPETPKVDSEKASPTLSFSEQSSRIFVSPAAKKIAEDSKLDIANLKGTGPGGRIIKADVEAMIESGAGVGEKVVPAAAYISQPGASYIDIPTSQIRRIIASRLLESKQTIPHYYLSIDVKVDKLNTVRAQLNAIQETNQGSKISVNDFIIKAAALACKKVPECNSSWANDHIRQYNNVDVNVAVQTDVGLMVPFVKNAHLLGIGTISSEVKRLAVAARENKLKPEEFQGGTFSVSNLGMFGIKSFCAVINPPQSAILAVGTSEKRVIPGKLSGEFETGLFMNVTLSCDHRVVDGAVGAKWLNAFKSYLEDPITMLL